ncbi:hypothetical protein TNCV_802581 [Trichonephila clavipes]|nr:hypothetical protein TNCV_802581 [Trichonephila clavipes]
MEQLFCWKRKGPSPKYYHRVGSAALSRISTYISEFMFLITRTNGLRPNHEKHPPHHYASTTQLNSRHSAVSKETFAGNPPNSDESFRLPDYKLRFITLKNIFPHVHSPMTVSSTPLQSMLRILWSDVWLVSCCTTMESRVF